MCTNHNSVQADNLLYFDCASIRAEKKYEVKNLKKDNGNIPDPNPELLNNWLAKTGVSRGVLTQYMLEILHDHLPKIEGDTGYVLCILDEKTGELLMHEMVGVLKTEDDRDHFLETSYEQCCRIFIDTRSICAYENRNDNTAQYGGSVRCDIENFIVGFSGSDETTNEIMGLIFSQKLHWISDERRDAILAINGGKDIYRQSLRS